MEIESIEQARLIATAHQWAQSDPCDPYRKLLLDEVLGHRTTEALDALRREMACNR